jgi:beta-lactamase class A
MSDNTATDHLLYTIGRRQVEAAVRAAKHAKPQLDVPFPATRELFLFKLALAKEDVAKYLAMPEGKRRTYLDTALAGKAPTIEHAGDWKTARSVDKLEWFASSEDLCHVMSTLRARATKPKAAPVLDVLAKNPGLPIDKSVFPYIGFKGGSEPGVVDMTYLLRRKDDRWFVVTLTVNADEGGTLEEDKVFAVAQGVIDVLGASAH